MWTARAKLVMVEAEVIEMETAREHEGHTARYVEQMKELSDEALLTIYSDALLWQAKLGPSWIGPDRLIEIRVAKRELLYRMRAGS